MAEYDFIIVGSGPAGASLASQLAKSNKSPSILLLEAGGSYEHLKTNTLAERYISDNSNPGINYGYVSVPQKSLNGRVINYDRGKILSGSSAINYAMYTLGPKDDYDHWAALMGDQAFNWENSLRRYKEMESYNLSVPEEASGFARPKAENHGSSGPLNIEYGKGFTTALETSLKAAEEWGLGRLEDVNTGEVIGVGIVPSTALNGKRVSASSAFLANVPPNLTIITGASVTKILINKNKAVGVEASGKQFKARKEVIISGGAIDTPKLLLLSGIGPKADLEAHGIECIKDLPGVGRNFQDHPVASITVELKDSLPDQAALLMKNDEALEAARAQFGQDGTGPLSTAFGLVVMGWHQNKELFDTDEFRLLPQETQRFLQQPNVPSWELLGGYPILPLDHQKPLLTLCTCVLPAQSTGTVKLASSNPADAPFCDPQLITHPFDRKNIISALRSIRQMLETSVFKEKILRTVLGPKSDSDEDIWEYLQTWTNSTRHPASTVKMGVREDPNACVDANFNVFGLDNLRVVDLSVTPFVPNCHPVSHAYNIGHCAAEKIIARYDL